MNIESLKFPIGHFEKPKVVSSAIYADWVATIAAFPKRLIEAYFEERWALLPDGKTLAISSSLKLLEGLHERWAALLTGLTEAERQRTFFHPEHQQEFVLEQYVGFYAWHCRHHFAHITSLKAREGCG